MEFWIAITAAFATGWTALSIILIVRARRNRAALRQTRRRLDASQEFANIGIWDRDLSTGILYWSKHIPAMLGRQDGETETTYEAFLTAVHPDDRRLVVEANAASIEAGTAYEIQYRVVWPDGTTRWLLERGKTLRNDDGDATNILGVARDVTEEKLRGDALRQSEAQFRDLAEGSLQGIIIHAEGKILFVNSALAKMFGYASTDDVLEMGDIDALYAPEERERMLGYRERRLKGWSAPAFYEFCGLRKDGERLWLQRSSRIINWHGKKAVQGTMLDITERVKSEERFRLVFENVGVGCILIDEKGCIETFNKTAEAIFGWRADEVVGRNVKMLMPPPYRDAHDGYLAAYVNGGDAQVVGRDREVMGLRKSGDVFPLLLGVGEIMLGGRRAFIGSATDLSDLKKAEFGLRRAKTEAERANHAKSEFLAHMSHELRTPLNSILGFSQLCKDQIFGDLGHEKYREYMDNVIISGTHLLEVINDILDLSKIEAGEMTINEEATHIGRAISDAINWLEAQATDKNVVIAVEARRPDLVVWADHRICKQIFLNLLENAVKFSHTNGTIRVEYGVDDTDAIFIRFEDDGAGIGSDELDRVLEPFGQAREGSQIAHGGTGLGLPLSKRLMELHGGRLDLESALDKGTAVTITFPPARTVRMHDRLPA